MEVSATRQKIDSSQVAQLWADVYNLGRSKTDREETEMNKIAALETLKTNAARQGLTADVARINRMITRLTEQAWKGVGTN